MTVTIKLNKLFIRILWAALGLLICLLSANSIFSHFLVRNIADRRIALNVDALTSAAKRFPNSSRIQFRLAEAELDAAMANSGQISTAEKHAFRSVELSPWDYRSWRLLALVKDADGKIEEATDAIQMAAKLAPTNSETNWMLGNMWLRQGKRPEALRAFQVATRNRTDLLPAAFEIVWQAFGNDVATLDELVGEDADAGLAQAQFLAEQGQIDASIRVFRRVGAQAKLKSPVAQAFVTWLIQANRGQDAREVWLAALGNESHQENGVWNGSFEQNSPKDFGHFDWSLKASNYARIGYDRSVAHSGSRSLKLFFVGRDTTKLENEIQQLVILKANVHYRLECYALAKNLVTPEGPKISLVGPKGVLAVSQAVATDAPNWQHLVVDFNAPSEDVAAYVAITRIPKADYDEPTKGIIWFDDFKLTEQ